MSASELTLEQQEILKTFRKELTEEGIISGKEDTLGSHHDHVLLRFLRARKFNVKNAKTMVVNCIKWRETACGIGIDELYRRTDPYVPRKTGGVQALANMVSQGLRTYLHHSNVLLMVGSQTDKKGRALNIQSLGSIDVVSLFKVVTPERHWETLLANAESLTREVNPACSIAAGKSVDDVLCIIDMKGFSLRLFWQMKNVIRDSFQISQDYYPETLGHLAIINAPYSFAAMWSIAKPWLAKETQEKIHILGSDYQPALLELVDAENLPTSFGGKCTCEGFGGCEASRASPWMADRGRRREAWLKGELERAGLDPGREEDVKLVKEFYQTGKSATEGDIEKVEVKENLDTTKEQGLPERNDVKSANRDVLITETPVVQTTEVAN